MKTYVISLEKNSDRLSAMSAQLSRLNVKYEVFRAVYGKDLSANERSKSYNAFRAYCIRGGSLSDGQLGCALSHLGVYRKMLQEEVDAAIILEDDVVLSDEFVDAARRVESFVRADRPQVVLFSAWNAPVLDAGIKAVDRATCADGYCITALAAKRILDKNYPVISVADSWTRWRRTAGIELYRIYPTTVRQDNVRFGTDVDQWENPTVCVSGNGTGRSGLNLIMFRCRRVVEKSVDWCLWLITGR